MKYFILLFLFYFLAACDRMPQNAVIVTDFPVSERLTGDTVDYFDSELGILDIKDAGKYWLCRSHRTDYHFAVFAKDGFKKVGELCMNGRGPGEFIAPSYFSQYTVENGNLKVWILERALSEFMKIDVDETILKDTIVIDEKFPLVALTRNSFRDLFYCGDSLLMGTSDDKECLHVWIDWKKREIRNVEPVLKFPDNFDTHNIAQSISAKHPSKPLMVSAFYNFPQIDFVDGDGKIYKTVFYKEMIKPVQVTASQEDEQFFSDVCSSAQYVYVLYNRESEVEEGINPDESIVLVFDWEGNPVREFRIPYASVICFEESSHRLYALNPRKETYNTTVYSLKD